ncbi:Bug family tripartite tricarboxylate transporter substrate binding protein [Cupriavidus basilensis]|uniref:Bug family tripartite tricarboxylate transporter substrate binding protein n=1 Tax=Cupriavidus basilensis TaxID=68895 RepID=UPI0020A6A8A6|nr:tripartite tricarboxylate transporter substrate binding protein [Cupriavidus basilensis]MCP3022550.1 tripartite tricarboxylate transporter substrate binding protein [Cupriavidus basilensis]MDR3380890.1 tripartite tricarboxylate transporter substrate binding protein [Cupriavidus basilensis]
MSEVRIVSRLWRGKAKLLHPAAMPACPQLFSHVWHPLFLAALLLAASGSGLARPVTVPATPAAVSARPISFPVRPIRLIVPFPAGGVPDAVARLLAERLAVRLGVPVDVDNRPGAGGTTAGDVVAKASSDGHTLLFHQATMLIQPGLEPVPYDVVRDFTPVARVATMPLFLVIDARLPMRTPQQWLAAVNASPGSYSYGSGQAGSPSHLYAQYAVHGVPNGVPLVTAKGEAAVVQEMLAGRVSACFCAFASVQAQVKSGNLRLLGVTGVARSQLAPTVPTLQESGVDGYGAAAWYGVIAPAKTPHAIVARIASELDGVMGEREVRDRLLAAGLTPLRDSPEAFATAIRSESIQWQVILRQTGGPTEP